MVKIKTSGLIGPALDWAVATCRGYSEIKIFGRCRPTDRGWIEVRFNPDHRAATCRYDPTVNWEFIGPIIEQHGISLTNHSRKGEVSWSAVANFRGITKAGPTPRIAACRCYVASVLGDEVDVPEGLI